MFVVAGVSGNTGKVVAEALLAEKLPVRVIVRSAEKGAPWKARGAEVAVAALDDVAALTKARDGARGAYLLLPPDMASSDARTENARRAEGYRKAIDASGVAHVVFLSSIGAQHASGTGPIGSLHDAEATLSRSTAALTFLRAAYFMENWGSSLYGLAKGELPTFLTDGRAIPMVATRDIGTTAAKLLVEGAKDARARSVVELAGPKDLSPGDVAAALGRVSGKAVKVAFGPEEYIVPALTGAGMNAHWAGLFREMIHGINAGVVDFGRGTARAVRGTTDIEAVLRAIVPAT